MMLDNEKDTITFKRKDAIATKEKKEISSSFNLPSYMEQEAVFKKLKHKTLITAVELMEDNQCSISLESLIFQFIAYVLKTGEPKNYNGAFIGFIKHKIENH
jgi:Mg/Co/Ni transporter MgtE